MSDVNEQFEEQLRRDLNSLTDPISIENLEGKVMHRLRQRTLNRRLTVGGAIAAGLLILWCLLPALNHDSPTWKIPPAANDMEKKITDAGISTELLLAAQTLARAPGGEELARENFQYLIAKYPNTKAARQAHESLYNRRNIQ